MNAEPEVFRLSDLPDPMLEQFRMRQLSVLNWGTFSGLHRMQVAAEGMLLLGPSGAGKSTLLDAISALIVPPRYVRFNAAADESSRKDHDRNLMSYVRGAWADRADEDSPRVIAKQYLRPAGTWSALALEYANANGRIITLVRILWVKGAATSGAVETHFMVVDGRFDINEIPDFQGERRHLKAQLKRQDIRHHENSFPAYAEHWCRLLGISDTDALELLHQTQSTKNLSDLNAFLRDFMLAEPPTFAVAKDLITEFVDLDQAHQAVVTARRQVQLLIPAREAFTERTTQIAATQDIEQLLTYTGPFRASILVQLLGQELLSLQSRIELAQAELVAARQAASDLDARIERLEADYAAQGGADLSAWERQRENLEKLKARARHDLERAQRHARALDWTLATDAAGFVDQVRAARTLLEESSSTALTLELDREKAAILESQLAGRFKALQVEIKSLETSPSSIPFTKQQIRQRLSEDMDIPLSRLPFAGELMEVKPEEFEWAGAANRLLGGFATNLLVHDEDYRKVASWVDRNFLGDRWTFIGVPSHTSTNAPHVDERSIVKVIEVQQHAFRPWIIGQLARQFDFERVDSIAELIKGERGITKAGQIKHSGRRHEKDDRSDINDRRHWVLGNNREKLARFREDAATLAIELDQASRAKREAGEQASLLASRKSAASALIEFRWEEVDVGSFARSIADIEATQQAARAENPALSDLEGQLVKARGDRQQEQGKQADAKASIESCSKQKSEREMEMESAKVDALRISQTQHASLRQRLPENWQPGLKSLRDDVEALTAKLHVEKEALLRSLKALDMRIVAAFADFLNQWPTERGALQPNLESAPDFFSKLQRLEIDGLPAHEERFLHLLRTQSTQRLAELYRHLTEARREIEMRLDDVNTALRSVPYNPDSYLHLRVEDLGLDEPREFRRRLVEVFQSQQSSETDPVQAEKQFVSLRQLILDLRGDEPENKRWRELVLDVRRHVHFIADELERRTDRVIENYSGNSGKSGGQRQKLTATCLAAALRFQLGGTDGGPPSYAAVVLDEAFTKTDNDFTATCMRIFTELGFQMIVATPVKSVMTLEPFVGGATYVSISNRHTSSMQHIAYLPDQHRLDLPQSGANQVRH